MRLTDKAAADGDREPQRIDSTVPASAATGPNAVPKEAAAGAIDGIAKSIDRLVHSVGYAESAPEDLVFPLGRLDRLEAAVTQLQKDADGNAVDIDDIQARMDWNLAARVDTLETSLKASTSSSTSLGQLQKDFAKLSVDVDWRLEAFRNQFDSAADTESSSAEASATASTSVDSLRRELNKDILQLSSDIEALKSQSTQAATTSGLDSTSLAERVSELEKVLNDMRVGHQAVPCTPTASTNPDSMNPDTVGQCHDGPDPALVQLVHNLDVQLKTNLSQLSSEMAAIRGELTERVDAPSSGSARLDALKEKIEKDLSVLSRDQQALQAAVSECPNQDLLQRINILEASTTSMQSKFNQDLDAQLSSMKGPQTVLSDRVDELEAAFKTMPEQLHNSMLSLKEAINGSIAEVHASAEVKEDIATRVDALEKEVKTSLAGLTESLDTLMNTNIRTSTPVGLDIVWKGSDHQISQSNVTSINKQEEPTEFNDTSAAVQARFYQLFSELERRFVAFESRFSTTVLDSDVDKRSTTNLQHQSCPQPERKDEVPGSVADITQSNKPVRPQVIEQDSETQIKLLQRLDALESRVDAALDQIVESKEGSKSARDEAQGVPDPTEQRGPTHSQEESAAAPVESPGVSVSLEEQDTSLPRQLKASSSFIALKGIQSLKRKVTASSSLEPEENLAQDASAPLEAPLEERDTSTQQQSVASSSLQPDENLAPGTSTQQRLTELEQKCEMQEKLLQNLIFSASGAVGQATCGVPDEILKQGFQTAMQKDQNLLQQQRLADIEHFKVVGCLKDQQNAQDILQERLTKLESKMDSDIFPPGTVQVMLQQFTGLEEKFSSFLDAQVAQPKEPKNSGSNQVLQEFCNTWKEDLDSLRKELKGLEEKIHKRTAELEEGIRSGSLGSNIDVHSIQLMVHEGLGAVEERWNQRTAKLVEKVCKLSSSSDVEVASRRELGALEERWCQRIVEITEGVREATSTRNDEFVKGLVAQEQEVVLQRCMNLQRQVQEVRQACGLDIPVTKTQQDIRRPLAEAPATKRPVGGSIGVLRAELRPSTSEKASSNKVLHSVALGPSGFESYT